MPIVRIDWSSTSKRWTGLLVGYCTSSLVAGGQRGYAWLWHSSWLPKFCMRMKIVIIISEQKFFRLIWFRPDCKGVEFACAGCHVVNWEGSDIMQHSDCHGWTAGKCHTQGHRFYEELECVYNSHTATCNSSFINQQVHNIMYLLANKRWICKKCTVHTISR